MKRVLFLQHGESDGPGLFARTLASAGVAVDVLHAWKGDPVPVILDGYDGLALGGGHMSVYEDDKYPFLGQGIALIREARRVGRPVLGMCLGAQMIAAACGGRVFRNTAQEIGFFDVTLEPAAQDDALWRGIPPVFRPVHWHGDTFSLPADAALLGSSALTRHQLFRIDRAIYGFQFHLEFDLQMLCEMIEEDAVYLSAKGVSPEAFLEDARRAAPLVEPVGWKVFDRWAQLLGER
jgi:GMP synthase-like glutamine amidotransferase